MNRVAFITCTFTALLTVAGCSSPDEKANTLYVQASIATQEAMLAQKQRRYQQAFASYEDARERIERILSNYSSSSVAVELISGERQIFKMPLEIFRELGMPMKIAADVEEDPLVSALFFAAKLDKPFSTHKAEVLIRIARGYTMTGQIKKADRVLRMVVDTADAIDSTDVHVRILTETAGAYAEAGLTPTASDILSRALTTANSMVARNGDRHRTAYYQTSALASIAEMYAHIGHPDEALQAISRAVEVFEGCNADSGSRPLAHIAAAYAEVGLVEKAHQMLVQAILDADEKGRHGSLSKQTITALSCVACKYAKAGQTNRADQTMSQALAAASAIKNQHSRFEALVEVADRSAEIGQREADRAVVTVLDAVTNLHAVDYEYVAAVSRIAGTYAKVGLQEKADQMLSEACNLADAIEAEPWDVRGKARALADIAGRYVETENYAQAGRLLSVALRIANHQTTTPENYIALAEIAVVLAAAAPPPSEVWQQLLSDVVDVVVSESRSGAQ